MCKKCQKGDPPVINLCRTTGLSTEDLMGQKLEWSRLIQSHELFAFVGCHICYISAFMSENIAMTGVCYDLPGSAQDRWPATARSPTSVAAPWPAPATSIHCLLLMLENVQFASLVMKSQIFCILVGEVFFLRPESITFVLWTETCIPSGVQSSTFVQPEYVRGQWWKPTQNQQHTKMQMSKVKV